MVTVDSKMGSFKRCKRRNKWYNRVVGTMEMWNCQEDPRPVKEYAFRVFPMEVNIKAKLLRH